MAKVLIIESCEDCNFLETMYTRCKEFDGYLCGKTNLDIRDFRNIPDSCPLPDVPPEPTVQADACPLCGGMGERIWNDGLMHPCSCQRTA